MTHITKHYDILRNLDESFIQKIKILSIRNHAKNYSVFMITNNDLVYGIGYNRDGCFGPGHNMTVTEPILLDGLSFKKIVRLEYGSRHIIALNADGKVFSLFKKKIIFELQTDDHFVGLHIIDICICDYHSLLLTKDGEVYSLNQNGCKLLDCKCYSYKKNRLIPNKILGFGDEKVKAISCGKRQALALTRNGKVFSWGINFKGELGIGKLKFSKSPVLINIVENTNITQISCGYFHSLLLSDKGYIYSFGQNTHGQLGYASSFDMINENIKLGYTPRRIDYPENVTNIISIGGKRSLVRTAERFYFIWGYWFGESIKLPLRIEPNTYLEELVLHELYGKNYYFNSEAKIQCINSSSFENEFYVISVLKQGMYGCVFKAVQRSDKEIYAIKRIEMNFITYNKLCDSIKYITNLNLQFSIRYEKVWLEYQSESPSKVANFFIQMEMCYSTLEYAIEKINTELDQKKGAKLTDIGYLIASRLFIEVLEIISYLHRKSPPLIHGGLTTKKFMLTFSHHGRLLKLGDFCMRKQLSSTNVGPDIKSEISDLGLICEVLFNIDVDEVSDMGSSPKLQDKYTNLFNIHRDMTARIKKSRPDCQEILESKNSWAIEPADISEEMYQKINQKFMILRILNGSKHENNLHDSILLKIFNEQIFSSKISRFEFIRQNSRYTKEYDQIKIIGSGSFGIVYEVQSKIDGNRYAIKKIPTNELLLEKASKEINFIKDLSYDFIVQYFESWIESNNLTECDSYDENSRSSFSYYHAINNSNNDLLLNIKMELCSQNLKDIIPKFLLDSNYSSLPILTKSCYYVASELLIEIMESIDYLHKQSPPIIHRDLKPANILITYGNNGRFTKICDFGLATVHEYDDQSHTQGCGTLKYMSPEVRDTRKYDMKTDIFGFGKIVQELLKFDAMTYRIHESEETNSLRLKYTIVSEFTKCLLANNQLSRKNFNTMLKKSETWAIILDDIKSENEFDQIMPRTETEVTLEDDFIKYFINKKLKSQ